MKEEFTDPPPLGGVSRAKSWQPQEARSVFDAYQSSRAEDPMDFTPEMADEAEGFFFLSFGKRQSGKSTLHYHLLRYIEQHDDFVAMPVVEEEAKLPPGVLKAQRQIINKWRGLWSEGRFPAGTELNDNVRAIRYAFRPKEGRYRPIEVTFLEVAGELLETVVSNDGVSREEIPEALDRLFRNSRAGVITAFIVNPTALATETEGVKPDVLYAGFLDYIREHYPRRAAMPLMLVLADPDEALRMVRKILPDGGETELTDPLLEGFLRAMLPTFAPKFGSWQAPREQRAIVRFNVGAVQKREIDGYATPIILQPPNFRDTAKIAKFVYETFSGTRIRHSWWRRLLMALGLAR